MPQPLNAGLGRECHHPVQRTLVTGGPCNSIPHTASSGEASPKSSVQRWLALSHSPD